MSKKLSKLSKVEESITVYRYDNGFMVEVRGRDNEGDWKTVKTLCASEDEMIEVIKEANSMEMVD